MRVLNKNVHTASHGAMQQRAVSSCLQPVVHRCSSRYIFRGAKAQRRVKSSCHPLDTQQQLLPRQAADRVERGSLFRVPALGGAVASLQISCLTLCKVPLRMSYRKHA